MDNTNVARLSTGGSSPSSVPSLPSWVNSLWDSVTSRSLAIPIVFQGLQAGTVTLTASIKNYGIEGDAKVKIGPTITSSPLTLEVYTPIIISPSKLVLLPGGPSYELQATGGPLAKAGARVVYETSESSLVSVTSGSESDLGVVYPTPRQGTAMITARAVLTSGTPVTEVGVPVTVDYPASVRIMQGPSALVPGGAKRLRAVLSTRDGQDFTAGHLTFTNDAESLAFSGGNSSTCDFKWTSGSASSLRLAASYTEDPASLAIEIRGVGRSWVTAVGMAGEGQGGRVSVALRVVCSWAKSDNVMVLEVGNKHICRYI
jgi:hypothetical protein